MNDITTTAPKKRAAPKSKLAAAVATVTKNILGADMAKPATVMLPKAVAELHVSPEDVIAAGTVITDEIAELAGLDEDDIADLEDAGHVVMVEVFAGVAAPTEA